jgi:thermitase
MQKDLVGYGLQAGYNVEIYRLHLSEENQMSLFFCRNAAAFLVLIPAAQVFMVGTTLAFAFGSVNDPLASDQWGWYRIGADRAYEYGNFGSGVVVAVLDTGINTSHPDLSGNIIDGWNYVDNNGDVTDDDGHGTMVAGIIAAMANNSVGIVGVASNVSIMPLKVLSGSSGGSGIDLDRAILGAAHSGARIITMSLGDYSRPSMAMEAAINHAYQEGCILVAGVGNDNTSDPFYPAACENVIAVGAIDQSSIKAPFSNYGSYIDFCAPGVNVLTTAKDGDYDYGNGTSFAAPFVTGVIALMISKYPQLTNEQIIGTLITQAEDLGETGWDQYHGWGLVNAYAACMETPIPEFDSLLPALLALTLVVALIRPRQLQKNSARASVRPISGKDSCGLWNNRS